MVNLFEYEKFSPSAPVYDTTHTLKKINENNYIWTFYCNWIWIAKRHTMSLLYPFVYFYGDFVTNNRDNFNSENQFYEFLKSKGCDVFYFFTQIEWDLWIKNEIYHYPTLLADNSLNSEIDKADVIATIIRHY